MAVARRGRRVWLAALVLLNLVVYSAWLGYSPVYMHDAEVLFALHARSIAATLRDSNGTFLPLYFHMPAIGPNVWFHPVIVYLTALVLKVLPFSEWSVRFPSAIVGTIDVVLMYLVALRLFDGRRSYAVIAAAMLALTPAHFIHSRLEMDYLYPVPFVLGWLWCLVKFDDTGDSRLVWAAGAVLGLGFYSYIAAVAFMPLYLVFTWVYLAGKRRRVRRELLAVTVAFCVPLIFFVTWRVLYPDVFSGTAYRYAITRRGVVFGVLHLLNYNVIGDYVSNYWNFFNPNFLFLVGSPNFQSSTRSAGVFLIPVALFLAVGVYDVLAARRRFGWLLVAGLVTAPIPAVLVEEPWAIYREMEILIFAVLIATYGVRRLLQADRAAWRGAAAAALLLMPLQFGYFLHDYFTDYRLNAFGWFGWNLKGAVSRVVAISGERDVPAVYLTPNIAYGPERWRFYLVVDGREDLMARTHVLDASAQMADVPVGSLVIARPEDGEVRDPRLGSAPARRLADITEPFGNHPTSFVIFERQ